MTTTARKGLLHLCVYNYQPFCPPSTLVLLYLRTPSACVPFLAQKKPEQTYYRLVGKNLQCRKSHVYFRSFCFHVWSPMATKSLANRPVAYTHTFFFPAYRTFSSNAGSSTRATPAAQLLTSNGGPPPASVTRLATCVSLRPILLAMQCRVSARSPARRSQISPRLPMLSSPLASTRQRSGSPA